VCRDFLHRNLPNVACGREPEVHFIELPEILIHIARENAPMSKTLEGDVKTAEAGEQVDESHAGFSLTDCGHSLLDEMQQRDEPSKQLERDS